MPHVINVRIKKYEKKNAVKYNAMAIEIKRDSRQRKGFKFSFLTGTNVASSVK